MSNIIACNLKQARLNSGLKVDEISSKLGVSQQTYYNYESGNREPSAETLRTLSILFDVSTDYLLGRDTSNLRTMNAPIQPSRNTIPVLGEVPAGIPIEAVEFIVDEIELPQSLASDSYEYFGLLVSGDSMYPEYMDGDIIVVRKQNTADSGDDVVAYVNGYNATLKRLIKSDKGLTLRALNPAYESKFYSNQEIMDLPIKIAGIVVEQRRNRR